MFLKDTLTLGASNIKVELISKQCAQKGACQDPWQFKIASVCSKPSQDKYRFAFQECAYGYRRISIGCYQFFQ